MALTPTLLQDAIVMIEGKTFGDFEKRHDEYGVLQAFDANAGQLLSPTQVQNMKKSVVQLEKVPVLNRYSPSIITDRSCNITGGRPTSAFVSLSYALVGFEITVIPSQNEANYITEAEDVAAQLIGGWRGIYENLDTKGLTSLETNKNTALVTSTMKNIATEAGDYLYTGDEKEMFLKVPSLMKINSINGSYEDIANTEADATLALINAFGVDNYYDVDGAIARHGSFRHYLSNRVTVAADTRETHYIAPSGSLGIYNWIENDFRVGRKAGPTQWMNMKDPTFGYDWGVLQVESCNDDSANSGNKTAYGYKAQIGAYFAFLTQYSSTAASPIVRINRADGA